MDSITSNIVCVLEHSKLIENKSLWHSCWKVIERKKANQVLQNGTLRLD